MFSVFSRIFGSPATPKHRAIPSPGPADFRYLGSNRAQAGLKIVGTSHYQREIAALVGKPRSGGVEVSFRAILEAEPTNAHDPNAIRVSHLGTTLGYLPAKSTAAFHKATKLAGFEGKKGNATIIATGGDTSTGMTIIGLVLVCDFPIRLSERTDL